MKVILPILFLATLPAFSQTAPGKADKPVIYDRNGRQVLPYEKKPVCSRSDMTSAGCAEKPESEKAPKPKHIG